MDIELNFAVDLLIIKKRKSVRSCGFRKMQKEAVTCPVNPKTVKLRFNSTLNISVSVPGWNAVRPTYCQWLVV